MSLELKIETLTEAINSLIATLQANVKEVPAPVEPKKPAKVEKPVAAVVEEAPVSTSSIVIDLQALAAKFTDLVEKDRPAAIALLAEYSIAKLGQANPDQFGEIYAKTVELLNG